jgi:hypothetical protein
MQVPKHTCSRVIDAGDRTRINHQPINGRGGSFDEAEHVRREAARIGIEEVCPELKN